VEELDGAIAILATSCAKKIELTWRHCKCRCAEKKGSLSSRGWPLRGRQRFVKLRHGVASGKKSGCESGGQIRPQQRGRRMGTRSGRDRSDWELTGSNWRQLAESEVGKDYRACHPGATNWQDRGARCFVTITWKADEITAGSASIYARKIGKKKSEKRTVLSGTELETGLHTIGTPEKEEIRQGSGKQSPRKRALDWATRNGERMSSNDPAHSGCLGKETGRAQQRKPKAEPQ